jgi:hypothetical protein
LTKYPTTVPTTQGFRAKRDNKLTNPLLRSHPLCACRADSFRYACRSARHLLRHAFDRRDSRVPQALYKAYLIVSIWRDTEVRHGRFAWG